MKKIIVQKFGGTSVADTDKIKNVARAVIREKNLGNSVVVVVSAMGHTTDILTKMAKEITPNPSSREMDMLLSTGEGVSIALLAMALQAQGCNAVSMNAMQVGIITENVHSKARILEIKTERIQEHLDKGEVVVIAGFQGVTEEMEITTLGRGGSDTSAVALAGALGAERCDIYTDVEGVYTTDPRIVPCATRLEQISYEEMLELARVGANVLHPRAVETAKQEKETTINVAKAYENSILPEAQAQADANKLLEESLSDKVIAYNQIQKWNGVMPKVTSGNNGLLINVPLDDNQTSTQASAATEGN